MNKLLSSSIVLYNNTETQIVDILKCIRSFEFSFFLIIDNSIDDSRRKYFKDSNFIYIHNFKNYGFGKGHNFSIDYIKKYKTKYHLVLNPDIQFNNDCIIKLLNYLENNSSVGSIMPEILNLDGTIQLLPKLLPTITDIFIRKFNFLKKIYNSRLKKYEMYDFMINKKICNVPVISGCFFIINTSIIDQIGFFDERYFLYFEDWDLSRRIHKKYKTIYFPDVSVFHGYQSDANKNFGTFILFVKSLIKYFNKWGWFFDIDRVVFNKKALSQ